MCVNDIICCGAKPLFFLDYIAIGKNMPGKGRVAGLGRIRGLRTARAARSSAARPPSTPGTMTAGRLRPCGLCRGRRGPWQNSGQEQNAAGRCGHRRCPPAGVHSNGYSLVRKVFDVENADLGQYYGELGLRAGRGAADARRRSMSSPVLAAIEAADVRGISHITGGGFYENIPRCIPDGPVREDRKESAAHPARSSTCSRAWAASRSAICSTPSTWASGMVLDRCKRTAPTRRSPRCMLLGQEAGVIGEIVRTRRGWSYADTRPHRRAGLRRRHEPAGAARRAGVTEKCRTARSCWSFLPARGAYALTRAENAGVAAARALAPSCGAGAV